MAAQPAPAPAPARGKSKMLVLLAVVAICSIGGGFFVPRVMYTARAAEEAPAKPTPPPKDVFVPLGEVNVNLAEGRLSRYLRVKIVLVTDAKHEKHVAEKLEDRKATIRNWLIATLSDKTLQDVTGRASINRIRREILEHTSHALFPEGDGHLRDVLFEEFMVQ